MLDVTERTIRLFLHVLATTIWVGGQITLARLVPGLRGVSPDAPKATARRFAQLAWPAYGVLIATGVWNILALNAPWSGPYGTTLIVKLVVVGLSGVAAGLHSVSKSTLGLAIWGSVAGLSAIGALFLGVLLHG
ncbi:MAG: CopD family protein [Acidimicrobiia bacterium]